MKKFISIMIRRKRPRVAMAKGAVEATVTKMILTIKGVPASKLAVTEAVEATNTVNMTMPANKNTTTTVMRVTMISSSNIRPIRERQGVEEVAKAPISAQTINTTTISSSMMIATIIKNKEVAEAPKKIIKDKEIDSSTKRKAKRAIKKSLIRKIEINIANLPRLKEAKRDQRQLQPSQKKRVSMPPSDLRSPNSNRSSVNSTSRVVLLGHPTTVSSQRSSLRTFFTPYLINELSLQPVHSTQTNQL